MKADLVRAIPALERSLFFKAIADMLVEDGKATAHKAGSINKKTFIRVLARFAPGAATPLRSGRLPLVAPPAGNSGMRCQSRGELRQLRANTRGGAVRCTAGAQAEGYLPATPVAYAVYPWIATVTQGQSGSIDGVYARRLPRLHSKRACEYWSPRGKWCPCRDV